ncbi:MAG: ankyrin repeat domain-containing protein [Verrucomicrobiota bacterium]
MKTAPPSPCFPTAAPVRRLACGLWLFASASGMLPAQPVPGSAPASASPTPAPAPGIAAGDGTVKPAPPLSEALKSALRSGLFEEEANRDFDKAITAYRAALELYDTQRPGAGTVLYRLAECLRKKGQPAEAVPLYRRVLAEFPADTDLCADARRRLAELAPGEDAVTADAAPAMTQQEANTLADLRVLAERNPEMLPQRNSTFNNAAAQGSLPTVRFFVERKVTGLDFALALNLAAKEGRLPVVKYLVEAKPAPLDFAGALQESAAAGNSAVVDYLLTHGADTRKDGGPALVTAMRSGRTAVIYKLIDGGADLNAGAPDPDGKPAVPLGQGAGPQPGSPKPPPGILRPLALALDARDERLARYLIEKGARCDVPSETGGVSGGKSPLHLAWNADLVRFLVKHGADREARDGDGLTPLLATMDNFGVAEALIAAGADLTAKDPADGTVIYHLTKAVSIHPAFISSPERPVNVRDRALRPPAANTDAVEKDDPRIPELRAAAGRILEAALIAGVPVDGLVKQFSSWYPNRQRKILSTLPVLALACEWMETPAQAAFLEQLITHGAKVNFVNSLGVTPLHTAAYRRNGPLVAMLLKQGADPMAENTAPLEDQNGNFTFTPNGGPLFGQPSATAPGSGRNPNVFFRYRPIHLIGIQKENAVDTETVLLLARATYARDFADRDTGVWQEYSVLRRPPYSRPAGNGYISPALLKITDPALDGKVPVTLPEAVMRAEPGLELSGSPEVHILRRRPDNDREAEDIVFDLNALTQANPPAPPELKPGDVLLLLPRPSKPGPKGYSHNEVFDPLPRNLALLLEERQSVKITLVTPGGEADPAGEWQVFRPLLSPNDNRTDPARHTAWGALSLWAARDGIFKLPDLRVSRLMRAGGEPVIDLPEDSPMFHFEGPRLFLRDGDRIELTIPDPAVPGNAPGNSQPRRKVILPASR